jgi:hypothetical protein
MSAVTGLQLFGICAFGALGLVAGLLGLCASSRTSPSRIGTLTGAAFALIGLGVVATAAGYFAEFGWPFLAIGGLLSLFRLARSERAAGIIAAVWSRARSPRWQWAVLAVGCPALAALMVPNIASRSTLPPEINEPGEIEWLPPLRMMPSNSAVTDEGRDLTLWQADIAPDSEERLALAEAREMARIELLGRAMRVAPPDRFYNCHGWIFGGGRCLLPDRVVDSILQENRYEIVEKPAQGDLVVYRNKHGEAYHSATVWAVGADGRVLLESKWGWMGCYLHFPETTPYGQQWTYYRSPRSGHLLKSETDSRADTARRRPRGSK